MIVAVELCFAFPGVMMYYSQKIFSIFSKIYFLCIFADVIIPNQKT